MTEKYYDKIFTIKPEQLESEKQWIAQKLIEIGEEKLNKLIQLSIEARAKAYAPYSNYLVGVAVLCSSGKMYSGQNTEVVTYSQTGHAEHNAINSAINGGENINSRKFVEAMVVCHSGNSSSCGACRQEIAEHCDNALILNVGTEGNVQTITSLATLLPLAFSPKDLGK